MVPQDQSLHTRQQAIGGVDVGVGVPIPNFMCASEATELASPGHGDHPFQVRGGVPWGGVG